MADLQIPENFCQQGDPKGKTSHGDGENFHYITGLTEMYERFDYAYKSQPIREHDCTVCMTCQEICPEGILIESDNQEWYEKAAGTYVMMKSTFVNPHVHD